MLFQDLAGMRRGLPWLSRLQESTRQVPARVGELRVNVDGMLKAQDGLVEATGRGHRDSQMFLGASARGTIGEERPVLNDGFWIALLHQQDIAEVTVGIDI